ncbi:MAG: hypothetical protein QM763_16895 [Agriterribacter sp.]
MSLLFHQFTWFEWVSELSIGWIIIIACFLYLFFQKYIYFIIALCAHVLNIFHSLPAVPNHMFFEWLVNLTLLVTIFYFLIKAKSYNINSIEDKLWARFMPAGKIALFILYFYVVFHKLNSDFFNPEVSCGGIFFEDVIRNFGLHHITFMHDILLVDNLGLRTTSIYLTIIAEAVIPILLIFRKTRNAGILTGVLFHLVLPFQGHTGIYSFSAMLFTFYVFFWGEDTFVKFNTFLSKYNKPITLYFIGSFIALIFIKKFAGWFLFNTSSTLFWFIYSVVYIVLFYSSTRNKIFSFPQQLITNYNIGLLWMSPIIIFINGLSPYLGLKTEFSYSMFSNLRTEGGITNHYLVPVTTQVFDYQKQIVTILETNNNDIKKADKYHQKDVHFVLFEFIRLLNKNKNDFYVKFSVGGKNYIVKKTNGVYEEDGGLDMTQNYWLQKFFRFRNVYDGPSLCQH